MCVMPVKALEFMSEQMDMFFSCIVCKAAEIIEGWTLKVLFVSVGLSVTVHRFIRDYCNKTLWPRLCPTEH